MTATISDSSPPPHAEPVTIYVDDPTFGNEGRQFADWCQSIGMEVCRIERYGSPHRDEVIDGLWEMYCR